MLLVSHVNFRRRFPGRPVLPDVAYDANDFHGIQGIEAAKNEMAHGIVPGECSLGQRFVDDGGKGCVIGVAVIEVAAELERNSQGGKSAGRHDGKYRLRRANIELWRSEAGTLASITNIFSGRKPRATFCSARKLLMNKPAPASSIRDKAISPTTSAPRMRSAMPPPDARDVPCFSEWFKSIRKTWRAGARPNSRLASRETPKANASTRPSIPVSASRGTSAGASATSARAPQMARSTPTAPASRAITMLSVISWRTQRLRVAPTAARMAISRVRATAFARSIFARFAQAISNTRLTAASIT